MRGKKTLRCLMALALPAALLMGCSSPSGIAVNRGQTVVMDPSVLTAGIFCRYALCLERFRAGDGDFGAQ